MGAPKMRQPPPGLMETDWPAGSREEKAQIAWRLRLAGGSLQTIATALGCKRAMASDYICDPHGDRGRKRRHKRFGICVDCGTKTFSGGSMNLPKRCATCATEAARAAGMSREEIIAAIQAWVKKHGSLPTAGGWRASGPDHPASSTVVKKFGGQWQEAIRAAGYEPMCRWPGRIGTPADFARTVRLYESGKSIAEIADLEGITRNGVTLRLRKAGISIRNNRPAPDYERAAELYESGLNSEQVAVELGVSHMTALRWARIGGAAIRPPGRFGSVSVLATGTKG